MQAGARQEKACEILGLDTRTVQRWRAQDGGDDRRQGPRSAPKNKLTDDERARVLDVVNAPDFRDLSPKQIVPALADRGEYIASESTVYRILREEQQVNHRERHKPPVHKPKEHVATAPNQVWSWDITYLRSTVRGQFFFLYLIVDVFSRKIVGWDVQDRESQDLAAALIAATAESEGVDQDQLVLHSDNGGPMKGATMLATLQSLGIVASFSRPSTSNDNPFSEALFRTMKNRPEYPSRPFNDIGEAAAWVAAFVEWYNTEHRHSAIRFVTPAQRHAGAEAAILANRHRVYQAARARRPDRWSGDIRNWSPVGAVVLNPDSPSLSATALEAAA